MNKGKFEVLFIDKLESLRGIPIEEATPEDCYVALASLIKDRITRMWVQSNNNNVKESRKQVYYFSLEFLLGKMLESNIQALGLTDVCRETMQSLDIDLDEVFAVETDPGLGNGGLGRLAACFMDSLASLGLPGNGCSIRYKYGLFEQKIVDGYQVEMPDNWLRNDNIWEIKKPGKQIMVKFFGDIKEEIDENGNRHFTQENYEPVIAMPYDVPMIGYNNGVVNTLRLWGAESVKQFNFESFSSGDYINAVSDKYSAEAISEVLYPDDSNYKNRQLRLKQQYFFVSAGVQSIIRHYKKSYGDLTLLPERVSIHINDTHPALAVPELMRILMDEEGFGWDEAWDITVRTISYTNHTIMPEALEKWAVSNFSQMLPRIYMIVQEINERFCNMLWQKYPEDWERIARMAIISNDEIRMASLAIVGSHMTNGVAKVHSDILKNELFRDYFEIYPERFTNMTNGVTHRRWVLKSNPDLSGWITDKIGDGWIEHPTRLELLDKKGFTNDKAALEQLAKIKRHNKEKLAKIIHEQNGVLVNPDSIFDVQIKRIHAYKRQLLMVMNAMHMYFDILDHPNKDIVPRTFIFAGKAAPSYHFAKDTIKLISTVGDRINNDPRMKDRMNVIFLENYRVSLAEHIFPASEVSEQISTASREASGTGNMKFMMNGAITLGTLDGANIEIREAVGEDNFITFGMTVEQVLNHYRHNDYNSRDVYNNDERIRRILDDLIEYRPDNLDKNEFQNIYDALLSYNDEFFVLEDFADYVRAHNDLDNLYRDREKWNHMSAMNIAYSGRFASDEVIRKYADEIWTLDEESEEFIPLRIKTS